MINNKKKNVIILCNVLSLVGRERCSPRTALPLHHQTRRKKPNVGIPEPTSGRPPVYRRRRTAGAGRVSPSRGPPVVVPSVVAHLLYVRFVVRVFGACVPCVVEIHFPYVFSKSLSRVLAVVSACVVRSR